MYIYLHEECEADLTIAAQGQSTTDDGGISLAQAHLYLSKLMRAHPPCRLLVGCQKEKEEEKEELAKTHRRSDDVG